MKLIQALAQHHSETLRPKLHDVCLILNEEVLYTLSSLFPSLLVMHFHLL